jgi:hypothetical protein
MINGCKESSQFSFTTLEFIVIELSHIAKLELVFQCLLDLGVTLNLEKTTIGFSEGRMVGHIVSKNGVATDPEKFDKISKLPFPTTKKTLRSFLGTMGYYRRFIYIYVAKAHPLTRFLRDDAPTLMGDEASKCENFK